MARGLKTTPRSREQSLAIAHLILSQDIGEEQAERVMLAATDAETEFFVEVGDRVGEVIEGFLPRLAEWLEEARRV